MSRWTIPAWWHVLMAMTICIPKRPEVVIENMPLGRFFLNSDILYRALLDLVLVPRSEQWHDHIRICWIFIVIIFFFVQMRSYKSSSCNKVTNVWHLGTFKLLQHSNLYFQDGFLDLRIFYFDCYVTIKLDIFGQVDFTESSAPKYRHLGRLDQSCHWSILQVSICFWWLYAQERWDYLIYPSVKLINSRQR